YTSIPRSSGYFSSAGGAFLPSITMPLRRWFGGGGDESSTEALAQQAWNAQPKLDGWSEVQSDPTRCDRRGSSMCPDAGAANAAFGVGGDGGRHQSSPSRFRYLGIGRLGKWQSGLL